MDLDDKRINPTMTPESINPMNSCPRTGGYHPTQDDPAWADFHRRMEELRKNHGRQKGGKNWALKEPKQG